MILIDVPYLSLKTRICYKLATFKSYFMLTLKNRII